MRSCVVVLCTLLVWGSLSCERNAVATSESAALSMQLRLFDLLAQKNPGYQDTLAAWQGLDRVQQNERADALAERNAHDSQIATLIDSLLSCDAYKVYFGWAHNLTPDVHRRIFNALPYRGLNTPGGVGETQLELFQNRDSLWAFQQLIAAVDVKMAIATARQWVPSANSAAPPTYYLMDGNAGAFTSDGSVIFDLCGMILSERPRAIRYTGLGQLSVSEIEATLAHEYQHVFAAPFLYPPDRQFDTWPELWEDVVIRRIVSEGVAGQCNPPEGFKKAIYEDTATVKFWLRDLERVVHEMHAAETTEDSVKTWLGRTYQETANALLNDYVARALPIEQRDSVLALHRGDRPDLTHMLGWWMVSHIVAAPGGHAAAVQLLSSPHELYGRYNATVTEPDLKIGL